MADQIIGTGHGITTAEWSTGGYTVTQGIVTSVDIEPTAEQEPIPNQAGGEAGRLLFNKGRTATVECLVKNGQAVPAPGASFTVTAAAAGGGNLVGVVVSAKFMGKLKSWQVFQITVDKKDAMTL